MRYLFVCCGGVHRSPKAAEIAQRIANEKGLADFTAHSVGLNKLKPSEIKELVSGYDHIIVMEKWMRNRIRKATSNRLIPININVSDDYERSDKILERTLETRLRKYI